MSPTSYQTAPPREWIVASRHGLVKVGSLPFRGTPLWVPWEGGHGGPPLQRKGRPRGRAAGALRTGRSYGEVLVHHLESIPVDFDRPQSRVVEDHVRKLVALHFPDLVLRQDVLVPEAVRGAEVVDLPLDDGGDEGAGVTRARMRGPLADAAREEVNLVRILVDRAQAPRRLDIEGLRVAHDLRQAEAHAGFVVARQAELPAPHDID